MTRLWYIDYDHAACMTDYFPIIVMQCDDKPTIEEAESAVYSALYTAGPIYIDAIIEITEKEMRGKNYILVGGKRNG